MSIIASVVAPWRAPVQQPSANTAASRWWKVICALSVLPCAAVLHNAVFHRSTCMLNNFGLEYTPSVVLAWLKGDPSLPLALVTMAVIYFMGLRSSLLRALIAPGFICTALYSLWIWDVPFSGRIVCMTAHDLRLVIMGTAVTSKLVLLTCGIFYMMALPAVLVNFGIIQIPAFAGRPATAFATGQMRRNFRRDRVKRTARPARVAARQPEKSQLAGA